MVSSPVCFLSGLKKERLEAPSHSTGSYQNKRPLVLIPPPPGDKRCPRGNFFSEPFEKIGPDLVGCSGVLDAASYFLFHGRCEPSFYHGVTTHPRHEIHHLLNNPYSFDRDVLDVVIRALHGNYGGLDKRSKAAHTFVWKSITTEVNSLRNKGVNLLRVYALESDKKNTIASKMNHNDVGLSLRRASRDGVELEQSNNLNVFLVGTMLSDSNDR
ncbi:hypothetical protein Tco_0845410 [Tanacetum coccineum]